MEIGDQKPKPGIRCGGGQEGTVVERRDPALIQSVRDTFGEKEAQRGRVVPRVHIIGSGRAKGELYLEHLLAQAPRPQGV